MEKNFLDEVKTLSEKKLTAEEEYNKKLDEIQLEYARRIIKEQATIGEYSTNLSIKIGTKVIDTLKNEGFNITKGMTTYKESWKDIVIKWWR